MDEVEWPQPCSPFFSVVWPSYKFYLGRVGQSILYLLFSWTFIPAIIGFIEGIIYLVMSDNDLEEKYGGGAYEGQPAFVEEKNAHNAPNKLKRQPWHAVSVAINSRSRKCCPRQPRSGGSLDCSFTPLCAVALARKGPAVCGSCRRQRCLHRQA